MTDTIAEKKLMMFLQLICSSEWKKGHQLHHGIPTSRHDSAGGLSISSLAQKISIYISRVLDQSTDQV